MTTPPDNHKPSHAAPGAGHGPTAFSPAFAHDDTAPRGSAEWLFETAGLDALGVLDDDERREFAAALAAAPVAVQRQVLAEQARSLWIESWLPDAEAGGDLRRRVVQAVMRDVAASRAAPAAGSTSTARSRFFAAAGDESGASSAADADRRLRHASQIARLARGKRVHALWRASALALGAAVVVLGALHLQVQRDVATIANEGDVAQLIDRLGMSHTVDSLFDPQTTRVYFAATDAAPDAKAVLLVEGDGASARLLVHRLPPTTSGAFRLVMLSESGTVEGELARFENDGALTAVNLAAALAPGTRLAIVAGSETTPLLTAVVS